MVPRPVPVMHESLAPLDAPLGLLGKSLLFAVLVLRPGYGKRFPTSNPRTRSRARRRSRLAMSCSATSSPGLREDSTVPRGVS